MRSKWFRSVCLTQAEVCMEIICGFCLDGKQSDNHAVSFHPFTLIQEQANICLFIISLVHTFYSPSISPLALQPAKGARLPTGPQS